MPETPSRALWKIEELPWSLRLLATLYILSALAALGGSFLFHAEKAGLQVRSIREYYQGTPEDGESGAADLVDADSGGAGSGPGLAIRERPSDLRLKEILHPHSFAVPLVLLALLFLFSLAARSEGIRATVFGASFACYALLFASPWLARAWGGGVGVLIGAGLSFYAIVGSSALYTLYAMWLRS